MTNYNQISNKGNLYFVASSRTMLIFNNHYALCVFFTITHVEIPHWENSNLVLELEKISESEMILEMK